MATAVKYKSKLFLKNPEPNKVDLFIYVLTKAYTLNACISGAGYAEIVPFLHAGMVGGLERFAVDSTMEKLRSAKANKYTTSVPCFPFYSVMLAIGNPTVHYFR